MAVYTKVTTEEVKAEPKPKPDYPCLMVGNYNDFVVLFIANRIGTCIHAGPAYVAWIGKEKKDWSMDCFKPFPDNKQVVLTNNTKLKKLEDVFQCLSQQEREDMINLNNPKHVSG